MNKRKTARYLRKIDPMNFRYIIKNPKENIYYIDGKLSLEMKN